MLTLKKLCSLGWMIILKKSRRSNRRVHLESLVSGTIVVHLNVFFIRIDEDIFCDFIRLIQIQFGLFAMMMVRELQ